MPFITKLMLTYKVFASDINRPGSWKLPINSFTRAFSDHFQYLSTSSKTSWVKQMCLFGGILVKEPWLLFFSLSASCFYFLVLFLDSIQLFPDRSSVFSFTLGVLVDREKKAQEGSSEWLLELKKLDSLTQVPKALNLQEKVYVHTVYGQRMGKGGTDALHSWNLRTALTPPKTLLTAYCRLGATGSPMGNINSWLTYKRKRYFKRS